MFYTEQVAFSFNSTVFLGSIFSLCVGAWIKTLFYFREAEVDPARIFGGFDRSLVREFVWVSFSHSEIKTRWENSSENFICILVESISSNCGLNLPLSDGTSSHDSLPIKHLLVLEEKLAGSVLNDPNENVSVRDAKQ